MSILLQDKGGTSGHPICVWCDEPVEPRDQHPGWAAQPMHFACGFRAVGGSAAHILQRCACYVPGSTEGDPPGMTKRQAAAFALETYDKIIQAVFN